MRSPNEWIISIPERIHLSCVWGVWRVELPDLVKITFAHSPVR